MPGARVGSVAGYRTPTVYVGPGDIISGAKAWWGLRAYSAATAAVGTAAVRVRRDSDNGEQDFGTLTNGNLDVASISSFKGAANLFVVTLYDQTGNAIHITQSTAANQPELVLNVLGSFPSIRGPAGSHAKRLSATWPTTDAQPWSLSAVARRTSDISSYGTILSVDANVSGLWFHVSSAGVVLVASGPLLLDSGNATESTFHSVHGLGNGASSAVQVDSNASGIGSTGLSSIQNAVGLVGDGTNTEALRGDVLEGGVWISNISSSFTSLAANQQSYWGF
jgi:hypothetical protein